MANLVKFKITQGLDNNNQTIANVAPPVLDTDASTKGFSSNASNLTSGTLDAARLAASGVTAGTYNNSATQNTPLVVDNKGRVTSVGTAVTITPAFSSITSKPTTLSGYGITDAIPASEKGAVNGIATLDSTGKIPPTQLPSYVDDVIEVADFAALPATGESGKIYVTLATNNAYRWGGSTYTQITSGAVSSVAGKTGAVTLVKGDVGLGNVDNTSDATKSVLSATKLTTARTIATSGDVTGTATSFDGQANITIPLTLANSGVTAGTYNNSATQNTPLTVDAKGRITSVGTAVTITPAFSSITGKPTTLSGYGITDAQPLDADLTSIAGLTGTSGLLRKTAANAWSLDTNTYLTAGSTLQSMSYHDVVSVRLTTTATTANQIVDSSSIATYRSVTYTIQVTSGSAYQSSQVTIIHDGTNVYMSEYGTVQTGAALATFDADISSGNLRLLVTPVNSSTVVTAVGTKIDV